jgi:DNA-binding NarL/FixJ family response regulator
MAIINIAVVDDHRLFVIGLRSLIENFSNFNILFEARNGKELTEKLHGKLKPHIILLDLNMPLMNGFETAEWLVNNHPEINVIVLSMMEGEETVLKLVKLGIRGYLLKDAEPEDFEAALHIVAEGGYYYPSFVTEHLVKQFNKTKSVTSKQVHLNDRELEFLRLTGTELTYKEIAEKLCVSARTVDGYRDHLFEKLNVKSRVGLVLYAIKNKLVSI